VWRFGFVLVTLGYGVEFLGLQRTSSGDASVLISLVPVFTIILGRVLLRERIAWAAWIGIGAAAVGSCWLAYAGRALRLSDPLGDGLLLVAAALNAYANMLGARDSGRMDPLTHVTYGFATGSAMLAPVALYEWHRLGSLASVTPRGMFAYLVVLSTAVAYVCFFYGLRRVGVSAGSTMLYLMGPITVVLAAVFLHETLTVQRLSACLVVTTGAALAGGRMYRE
jgi:probable blue pigment (indigoidine) exporter